MGWFTHSRTNTFRLKLARVSGFSMSPNFQNGDYVLAAKWPGLRFKVGNAVLVDHPIYGLILKRINTVGPHDFQLRGDNPESTSPEAMGWIKSDMIIGRVFGHISSPQQVTYRKNS